jgi:DNA repair exonuclease SbcCD ATPase subunit
MIRFKTIKWRNFLSTGAQFTEVKLDHSSTTLIVGENGSGKSTILDALCFVLFNKPFRNINKPQLVNTINQKNMEVQVEFSIGKKEYRVVRGTKPGVFEIHVDNQLINQDAASKDYQKLLEESILKLNYKSFTQIVILGSASFTPFMQLPLGHRREIIEDILDIQIFTVMNSVLKEKLQENKTAITDIETRLEVAKQKIKLQQDYIKTLENDKSK